MSSNDPRYAVFESRTRMEEQWTACEDLFNAHGYKFRPRLRKGWTPSWHTTGESPLDSEDGELLKSHLVDAYTDDGKSVCIKKVRRATDELRIAQILSTKELLADPRNHCAPVIEVIDDPNKDSISYMVMPMLRLADNPPFQYVKEIIDFVDQILEGLEFMHEKRVAHRDCVMRNLMMDADAMFPEGFHPLHVMYKRDYSGWADYFPRSTAGVKYYFVDFGISSHIPEDDGRFVVGNFGRDRDPPELSATVPYDPFKLDIFIIGNMLRRDFYEKFSNVDFLLPLILWMTDVDPEERPTAGDALRKWSELREEIPTLKKEWRPRPREENVLETVAFDATSLYSLSMNFARSFSGRLCRR